MKYYNQREQILHTTAGFPMAYYPVGDHHPRYYMMHHWHTEFELVHVVHGSLELTLDRDAYSLSAGEFALIAPGTVHSATPDRCFYECVVFNLEALLGPWKKDDDILSKILSQRIGFPAVYRLGDGIPELAMSAFLKTLRERKKGFEIAAASQALGIFYALTECGCLTPLTRPRHAQRADPFGKAVKFIEENYSSHLTLEALAENAGMSRKYFSAYFKKISQKAPFDYINEYRTERACEMLIASDKPITEIAFECGFNDASYFTKTFKQYKGQTQKEYRAGHR